jgi:hypothetical protein
MNPSAGVETALSPRPDDGDAAWKVAIIDIVRRDQLVGRDGRSAAIIATRKTVRKHLDAIGWHCADQWFEKYLTELIADRQLYAGKVGKGTYRLYVLEGK